MHLQKVEHAWSLGPLSSPPLIKEVLSTPYLACVAVSCISPPLPHRLDRLGPRLGDKNNRAAFEPEGPPQRSRQIFLVGLREKFVPVHEKEKGRRRLLHLRRIEKFQPMPGRANRLPAFDGVQERTVEDGGRDFLG